MSRGWQQIVCRRDALSLKDCSWLRRGSLQVQALAAIIELKRATYEDAAAVSEAEAYHARKQAQLQQLREAALQSHAHRQLSAWCAQTC